MGIRVPWGVVLAIATTVFLLSLAGGWALADLIHPGGVLIVHDRSTVAPSPSFVYLPTPEPT
ncbi:MAG TPA: hypothetical protein VJX92_18940 [Methylomirabilota bacterium]|nr:hypothetical protein [Methylomirabilota bacterium]